MRIIPTIAKSLLMTATLSLSGCQSMMYGNASELNDLQLGMTKHQVVEVLGDPNSTSADADTNEETLVYKKMRHTMSWAPRLFQVTLRNGHVVKWGERDDQGGFREPSRND